MKKILFWIDSGLVQYFVAKIMKEKTDYRLYGIFDHSSLNKTLYNEDKTTFEKKWFFWDHVKNEYNADLTYLKKIEEKYKIDLWRIIYAERVFFNNYYHMFNEKEVLGIIEQECKLYEKILDENKPDFLIMRMYDWHRMVLLKEMCKKEGVKILLIVNTRAGKRVTISSSATTFDESIDDKMDYSKIDFENVTDLFVKNSRFAQVRKRKFGVDSSMTNKLKSGTKFLKDFSDEYSKSYDHYGITRRKIINFRIQKIFKTRFRKRFLDNNSIIPKESNEKFILFPLHVQPERTIDVDGDFVQDQISLVEKISKSLPIGFFLYVKENPSMRFREWRKISDYKRILRLPNVKLIHYSVDSLNLIKKSKLVITIAGTAGLEAAILEKPSIVFAEVDYEWMSSITRIKNLNDLPTVIKKLINTKVNREELKKLYQFYILNTFEFDSIEMDNRILDKFHNEGYVPTDKIYFEETNEFIIQNKDTLEKLTNEYLKKIELCQQKSRQYQ